MAISPLLAAALAQEPAAPPTSEAPPIPQALEPEQAVSELPTQWWGRTTLSPLVPSNPHYLLRHRELMDAAAAGRGASPLYRDPWTLMEVHWALVSWNVEGLSFTQEEAERYRDLAVAAATLGAQDLLNETLDRSDALASVRGVFHTVLAPGFDLRLDGHGPTLRVNGPAANRRSAQEVARISEPSLQPSYAPPGARLRMGSGWALRAADPEDPESDFSVNWGAWLLSTNLGVDALRLGVDVVELALDDPARGDPVTGEAILAWSLTAREQLIDDWSLIAETRSVTSRYDPRYVRGGLAWQFAPEDPRWNLRATYTYSFGLTEQRPLPEQRVDLRLQWAGRWITPTSPSRWPLGVQPDNVTGPVWPTARVEPALRTGVVREVDETELSEAEVRAERALR